MTDKRTVKVSFRSGYGFLPAGRELDADHPAVKRYPSMFEGGVRTTAAVPGTVVDPDEVSESDARPAANATKAQWRAYVASLGGGDAAELTKSELVDLADELEKAN